MTPRILARKIRKLRPLPPITSAFERILEKRGIRDHSRGHYTSQREHWLRWLREQDGPGHYGRKKWNRSAEVVYNHINCPPMVLWLGEAVGVPKKSVVEAKKAALAAPESFPAQSAAIRRIIRWEMIEVRVTRRGT